MEGGNRNARLAGAGRQGGGSREFRGRAGRRATLRRQAAAAKTAAAKTAEGFRVGRWQAWRDCLGDEVEQRGVFPGRAGASRAGSRAGCWMPG